MQNKKQMVQDTLSSVLPAQEQNFLKWSTLTINPFNVNQLSNDEMIEIFIRFEEQENECELTQEILNEVLKVYIPMFNESNISPCVR